jgi:Protein of unknown function (DUF3300)
MTPRKAPRGFLVVASTLFAQVWVFAADNPSQVPVPPDTHQPAAAAPVQAPAALSTADELVAPIALYPDPLIALILPASTVPADISAAQAYLVQYGDMTRIDSQPWDPSVRGLAHYPAVITWMADNPAWTAALGAAFLASPQDVMNAIQRLRSRALAAGVLASTMQQRVYSDNGQIEILPGQPDSLYVPAYDADAVFQADPGDNYGGTLINYGPALDAGPWLGFCLDWNSGAVWVGGWSAWHGPGGWYQPRFSGKHGPAGSQPWLPRERNVMPSPSERTARSKPVPHPHPIQGAPTVHPGPQSLTGARIVAGETRPGAAEPRNAAPEGPQRTVVEAPAPARVQAAAPHPAAASAPPPAAPRDSSPATPTSSDPKNH